MAVLSARWDLDRTATIERALAVASSETMKILPSDPKEVAEVVGRLKLPATLSPEERAKKADDFYRSNMAKGKK